jgi:hypothetical protein
VWAPGTVWTGLLTPQEFANRTVQPVASRYTNQARPAQSFKWCRQLGKCGQREVQYEKWISIRIIICRFLLVYCIYITCY